MDRSAFRRLSELTDTPVPVTPETWRQIQPCREVRLGKRTLVITQPTSTFWVYLLGGLTTAMGIKCAWLSDGEELRAWWSLALLLWGVAALLAGTSYQAFGFHIKCSGRAVCSWTSWWEVSYLILQYWSMCALLIADALMSTSNWMRRALIFYAVSTAALYTVSVLAGALRPIRSWITFERLVLVSAPIYFLLVANSTQRWFASGNAVDANLLLTWMGLLLSIICYAVYDYARIGPRMWREGRGRWFSENDVLHVTLILWMAFIELVLLPSL